MATADTLTDTATVRVAIADDQPLIRAGLAALLAAQPGLDVVTTARTGHDAVKAAATCRPDVLLLDLGDDPAGTVAQIVADGVRYCPGRPVRVLAMAADYQPHRAWQSLSAGAAGFMLKSRPAPVLLSAIHAVAGAGTWLDPVVLPDMLTELAARPTGGQPTGDLIRRLTAREREVLVLLAHGLGNREIAARLFLSDATVRTHIGRILMKLGCRDRTRAVVVAYRSGLVRVTAPGGADPGRAPACPARSTGRSTPAHHRY